MTLKAHIRTVLKQNEAVAALVGTRIYSGRVPQNAECPHVFMFCEDTDFRHHLRGGVNYRDVSLQVNCIAVSSDQADFLADKVIEALDGYKGTENDTTIKKLLVAGKQDDFWSDDVGLNRTIVDFKVGYSN